MSKETISPAQVVAHLQPALWAKVNRLLVAKAISEFAHELLIEPKLLGSLEGVGEYVLETERAGVEYRFRARKLGLDHWSIDTKSLRKLEEGREAPLDALRLVTELRTQLQISSEVLPEYLEELSSTLYGAAYKYSQKGLCADELTRADFQQIEAAMIEGHPIFVANNGRRGFSAIDYPKYAPEAASEVRLVWLAANKRHAEFTCVPGQSYAELMTRELGPDECATFTRKLREHGFDPDSYLFLPVHPWQWENRLAQLFASDLANGDLVYLGLGRDHYLAQQSIRTFFNLSHPEKHYVKTALSIVNMGFTRGMPSAIASFGPAVNDWVQKLVEQDAYLEQAGFSLLLEVAFVAYRHRYYEAVSKRRHDPYKETLAALWRESPMPRLKPRQRLLTMAALLYVDREGVALLPALIRASGLSIDAWLARYLNCYLQPLVHCFYAHNLTFTPHCENVILVLEDNAPVGVILKDIAEDIGVLNPERELPTNVQRLTLRVPDEVMTLAIFTDVFDCVFRFLAALLEEHMGYPERVFWRSVAECIDQYQRKNPVFEQKFRRYDLFTPTFIRNCLNRLQLRNTREMVDLNATDPVDSLQFVGRLQNPIAPMCRRDEPTDERRISS